MTETEYTYIAETKYEAETLSLVLVVTIAETEYLNLIRDVRL